MKIDCSGTRFCGNLQLFRKKRGMSRLELARQVGIPRSLLKILEEAEVVPALEYELLERICQALHITLEELLHTELEDVS